MASRLFQEVREKAALAYSVECDFVPFLQGGIFTVYVAMSPRSIRQGFEILGRVLTEVGTKGVTEEELLKTKHQLRGMILLSSEQMEVRQESLARNELILGRPVTIEETIEKILAVTPKEIGELAKELFVPEKESVLVVARSKPKLGKLSVFQ